MPIPVQLPEVTFSWMLYNRDSELLPVGSGKITENDTLNTGDGRYSNIVKITKIIFSVILPLSIGTITGSYIFFYAKQSNKLLRRYKPTTRCIEPIALDHLATFYEIIDECG